MNRIAVTFAAALAAALTGLCALTAAPAEAADGTVVVSPAAGAEVPAGTDSVTVQFGATDSYEVDVEGPSGYYEGAYYDADAGESHAFDFPAMYESGSYQVTVFDSGYDVVATSDFTVAAPPVRVSDPTARPSTFYPVVRDRYKDGTSIRYTLNRRADITISVYRKADEKRVRATDLGMRGAGRREWTWNGLTNAGKPVRAGKYRVEVEAQAADGTSATARTTVTAATATVTRHKTLSVRGNRTSSTSHRGNCYVNRDSYFGETRLDCWAGVFAQATYRFALPANAQDLAWRVRGETGCCDQGRLIRTGTRLSARSYRVLVKVTNWRAYTVSRVSLSYSYRDRI